MSSTLGAIRPGDIRAPGKPKHHALIKYVLVHLVSTQDSTKQILHKKKIENLNTYVLLLRNSTFFPLEQVISMDIPLPGRTAKGLAFLTWTTFSSGMEIRSESLRA